jgi:hypothetical protein
MLKVVILWLGNHTKSKNPNTVLENQTKLVFIFLIQELTTFLGLSLYPLKVELKLLLTSFFGSAGFRI